MHPSQLRIDLSLRPLLNFCERPGLVQIIIISLVDTDIPLDHHFNLIVRDQVVDRQETNLFEHQVYLSAFSQLFLFVLWHWHGEDLGRCSVTEYALLLSKVSVLLLVRGKVREKPERPFGAMGVSWDKEPVLDERVLHFQIVLHFGGVVFGGVFFRPVNDSFDDGGAWFDAELVQVVFIVF